MSARKYQKPNKYWRLNFMVPKTSAGKAGLANTPTRQQRRYVLQRAALRFIDGNYGGEPRRVRRSMAFALAKRSTFAAEVAK